MNVVSDNSFGLVDARQRQFEGNKTVGREGEVLSAVIVIPTIHETSFRGISIGVILLQIKKNNNNIFCDQILIEIKNSKLFDVSIVVY
jgi:hypothetical protein